MRRALMLFVFISIGTSFLLLGVFASPVRAQVASTDPISLELNPEYPVPYQAVTISPTSSVFDINGSTITVTVNGTAFYKGSGGTDISVPMGGPGSSSTIVITAVSAGQTYQKTLVLRPADVALVVEPDSTSHPFYQGHGLVSSNGRVRIIAVPDLRTSGGAVIPASTLEYTWKFGDQILEEDSGIGKSILTATAPQQYRDALISVLVTDPASSEVAQSQVSVSPVSPLVRVYENDPLLGVLYDNALSGAVTMPDTEDTYRGVGYYFAAPPSFVWNVNSVQSSTANDITVRANGDGQGTAVLDFTATDQADSSRLANSTLAVTFGQKSSGLFGL